MREILFRGKSKAVGSEWLYGDVLIYEKSAQIWETINGRKHNSVVSLETVGQYTGLRDCKRTKEYPEGQMIFEGDIVRFYGTLYDEIFSVVFADGCFRIGTKNGYAHTIHNLCSALEVIGNIHDNPELLKGE